jgi:hypothetical protein
MRFASKLVAALAIHTVALASPVLVARSCKPNFQGNPLTIYQSIPSDPNDVLKLTPVVAVGGHITLANTAVNQAFTMGDFLIEFTGLSDGTYHIKSVPIPSSTSHILTDFFNFKVSR